MKRLLICVALLLLVPQSSSAGDLRTKDGKYDFFGLARYPEGGKLVEGVELYKVKEPGGAPDEYVRRVVAWWPRRGVDIIEVADGMIEREWTRAPSMLEEAGSLDGEPEIEELNKVGFPPWRKDNKPVHYFIRRVRGYLHPPEDDNYRVMVSADTMGFFFVSTDEKPENKVLRASLTSYSRYWQFNKFGSQISKPIPMKKGRKYYYEIIHNQMDSGNHLEASWEGDKMPRMPVGPDYVSTLDGREGKVVGERWKTSSGGGVRAADLPRTFKAHLIGFDGAGNEVGYPDPKKDFVAPNVILRMADGCMRTIAADDLCRKDQEFIIGVYVKEMQRVRATLDKTVYTVRPRTRREFPGGTPLGKPGSWLKQSEHMVVPSGSQGRADWLNVENPELGKRYRDCIFSSYENMHAFLEYCGHLMPYWDRKEKYKYEGRTGGTILNGYEQVGSGPGGGYGAQGLIPEPKPGGGFAHEYGHGFSIQWNSAHSGEILATAVADIVGGGVWSDNSINRPYRNCLHGSYLTTLFYRFAGMDPNWGLCAMTAVPPAVDDGSFYGVLARLGRDRGLFKDGIRGVGDMVGDYGARFAEFDYLWQEQMRMKYFSAARNYLEPVDKAGGVYRIPWDEAPEPFGVNIVRLVPETGGDAILVDFQGYHDPAVYSDWRACIVAVDRKGRARYSDLWNKGLMRMPRRDGDRRYWLTVAATPSALMRRNVSRLYQGQYAPRYTWRVTLRGAVPGTPHRMRTDLDDVYCAYGPGLRSGTILPAIPNSQGVKRFVEKARAYRDEMRKRMRNAKSQVEEINCMQMVGRAKDALSAVQGAPHPNGGGWVAATAEVAPTAYVGPQALVLGEAKVLDHAIVEDCAVLTNNVVISGHARVSGQAFLEEGVEFKGYQRVWFPRRHKAGRDTPELTNTRGGSQGGLWANYAMDQAEAVMLEDYYRGKDSSRTFFFTLPNGYLYGRPKFVVEDGHRGLAFDGRSQYAELNRRVADLGEITMDMTVKWQGKGRQTLLDCGSGLDNRFTLTTGGKSGGVVFEAHVDGNSVVSLISSKALMPDVWTRVCLEIDGRKIALWLNDKPAGEKASDFRPAHVFKPGAAQRNFIAAGRNGKGKFEGIYDEVVVYQKVHGQAFAELPDPVRDAPRRPRKGYARDVRLSMGMSPFEQADRKSRMTERMLKPWSARGGRAMTRILELHWSVPEYRAAAKKAKEFDQWKKDTRAAFTKEFEENKQAVELKAQMAEVADKIKAINAKIAALPKLAPAKKKAAPQPKPTEEMVQLQKQIAALELEVAELEKVEKKARAVVAAMPETKAVQEEIARLEKEIKPLVEKCREKLKKVVENDPAIKALNSRPPNYVRADMRVMRAFGGVGNARGGLAFMVRERLKARDPEFRKWADGSERIEDLKREELYRLSNYLLRHTDHPKLLAQSRWDQGDLGNARNKLKGLQRRLQDAQRNARQGEVPGGGYRSLQVEKEKLDNRLRGLRTELNRARVQYVDKKMREAGLNEKTTENEDRLKKAGEVVSKKYHAELHTLYSFLRQNFHGYYNGPINMYIGIYADRVVGSTTVRDNLDQVAQIEDLYGPDNWQPSVDRWDRRTRWEIDGSIADLPLTQKWLKRVRGK